MMWIVIWVASIFVSYMMAKKRNRSPELAIVGGVLFGWFSCLYYLLAGDKKTA